MNTPIRISTTVLAGGRIEVEAPELEAGQAVDLLVTPQSNGRQKRQAFLKYLTSLPSRRSQAEWEKFEQDFQAERDAWER